MVTTSCEVKIQVQNELQDGKWVKTKDGHENEAGNDGSKRTKMRGNELCCCGVLYKMVVNCKM